MKKSKFRAVALHYDGDTVPKVIAKGRGRTAKEIIAKGRALGIPLEKNEELTALLTGVRINEEIPQQLYAAVAQILAFLYYINDKRPGEKLTK